MSGPEQVEHVEPAKIAVCADPCADIELLRAAARLAVDLGLTFAEKPPKKGPPPEVLLVAAPGRLELRVLAGAPGVRGGRPVCADLTAIDTTSPAGRSLKQPLLKAVGIKSYTQVVSKPPVIIDATAGWGEDSWLLAALGCRVLSVERNNIVATLLRDGVLRAALTDPRHAPMLQRLTVVYADAKHMLRRISRMGLTGQPPFPRAEMGTVPAPPDQDLPAELRGFLEPDVVYLDPMFPGADTRTTAERKPLRVLRRLVGDDADAGELFHWALRAARQRVVVKRPLRAVTLIDPGDDQRKPDIVFKGKSVRFDVYVVRAR